MSEKVRLRIGAANLPSAISSLIAIRRIIANRDIGDIVGMPIEEFLRAKPHSTKLTVFFCSVKTPPFRPVPGKRFVQAVYNIPNVKPSFIKWEKIKQACGGANGYNWGRFRCTANLDNGRQMQIYGGTAEEAEERLKALAALSTAKITTVTVAEEKKEGQRKTGQILYKQLTRIYPVYFTVVNSEKIAVESRLEREELEKMKPGDIKTTLSGTFRRHKTQKLPLWVPKEPKGINDEIKKALKVSPTAGKK